MTGWKLLISLLRLPVSIALVLMTKGTLVTDTQPLPERPFEDYEAWELEPKLDCPECANVTDRIEYIDSSTVVDGCRYALANYWQLSCGHRILDEPEYVGFEWMTDLEGNRWSSVTDGEGVPVLIWKEETREHYMKSIQTEGKHDD